MKVIRSYSQLVEYVNRVGVLPDTNIYRKQESLVRHCDDILRAAGGKYPFRVHFHRKKRVFEVKAGAKGRAKSVFV